MRRRRAAGLAAALALLGALEPAPAAAAGLFLAPRGVWPLARAGALVAGADDVHALSYNPAGLARAAPGLLLDVALPWQRTDFTQQRDPAAAAGAALPALRGTGLGLPLPTLGVVHGLGLRRGLVFGATLGADTPALHRWPTAATGPQRYGAADLSGTALAKLAVGAGYAATEWLSVGGSLQLLAGSFAARNVVSACDGVVCTQPENPDYDATIQVRSGMIVAPGVQAGVRLQPWPWLALGLAWESGYHIDQQARLAVRLPAAAAFAGARLDPAEPTARLDMRLPQQVRAGVEVALGPARVEAAYVYEPWSVHERIGIAVQGARLRDVLAMGDYGMPPVSLPRGFVDSWSARLGAELRLPARLAAARLRAGALYEPSAVPAAMLTPMAVDFDKLLVSLGAELPLGPWTAQASAAQVMMRGAHVRGGAVRQVNPTQPAAAALTTVGDGDYSSRATLLGVGLRLAL